MNWKVRVPPHSRRQCIVYDDEIALFLFSLLHNHKKNESLDSMSEEVKQSETKCLCACGAQETEE